MAAWAPLIPFSKSRLGIDDGTLGLLLFCIAAGSMLLMPFSGRLIARFGCRALIVACVATLCADLPAIVAATSLPVMAAALFVFGAANGLLDVAMNAQAVVVERESGQPRMSGFHGLYSIGSIAGAGGVSVLLAAGVAPLHAVLAVVLVIAIAALPAAGDLLPRRAPEGERPAGTFKALLHPGLLPIALLCFLMFLIEGAMLDWSAVFLHTERGVDQRHAGFGFTLYSIVVALGRMVGDRIVDGIGSRRTLVLGSLAAAAGLLLIVTVDRAGAALAGFMLAGAGLANIVPVLFTRAGNQPDVPSAAALPAVTLLGYAGLLCGPALIGQVARQFNLTAAFAAAAVAVLAVALLAPRITR
ncbi:MFS transporter [Pseudoduganella flava]|uniref:MFS transporter n=2 Tax=Pseudoduganella flava TaxID=871742 RepID=A0ABX6G0T0_9BURK|nr:MFS transporter [Pseudoduganella flava]